MIRSNLFRILMSLGFVCTLLSGCGKRREVVQYEYFEPGHTCSVGCHDHYYVDRNVIYVKGHRHSRNCGHYWDGSCWRQNRAARLNPRPYSSAPIHLDDRHGHYNQPKPRDRDRYNNRDRRNNHDDRRIDNSRRNDDNRRSNDRHRQSNRNRSRASDTRPKKVNQTMRQKSSGDRDD
ncbi:MAG: hypothetical protein KDA54_22505 [Phycisphaerales bacterium]|nr:hypothetical protein [Phycisphaerales bacterium]